MSYMVDGYYREVASSAPASARAAFIRRTYLHLAGAVVAFVGLEAALMVSGVGRELVQTVFAQNGAWVGLMLLFLVGGYGAQYLARSRQSVGLQYFGLTFYVLLEVLIFLPLMTKATDPAVRGSAMLPLQAGIVTLLVFCGLTVAVFVSGKDFSFLGPFLWVAGLLAFGVVLVGAAFGGFSLGLVFCSAMVALAAGFIIYDTSNVIHRYGTNEHVAASLELFASVALLFWYVLRIFWAMNQDD